MASGFKVSVVYALLFLATVTSQEVLLRLILVFMALVQLAERLLKINVKVEY